MKTVYARISIEAVIPDELYEELMDEAGYYIDNGVKVNNEFDINEACAKKILELGTIADGSYIPENCIRDKDDSKTRIFIDMDGTINKWEYVGYDELYREGFFLTRTPDLFALHTVKSLIKSGEYDVYVLSACLMDSDYALDEKNAWLDYYLPEIPPEKRIFLPCGSELDKSKGIPGGIRDTDILIDDYTYNCKAWEEAGGKAIKYMNDLNNSKGTWLEEAGRCFGKTTAKSKLMNFIKYIDEHPPEVTRKLPFSKYLLLNIPLRESPLNKGFLNEESIEHKEEPSKDLKDFEREI